MVMDVHRMMERLCVSCGSFAFFSCKFVVIVCFSFFFISLFSPTPLNFVFLVLSFLFFHVVIIVCLYVYLCCVSLWFNIIINSQHWKCSIPIVCLNNFSFYYHQIPKKICKKSINKVNQYKV